MEGKIDLYKLLLEDNELLNAILKEAARVKIDFIEPFHMNTIEILSKNIEGISKNGDFLVCVRNIDLIAIIDRAGEKILWSWGQRILDKPHQPTLLDNGNILIFDNGKKRKYSRIIELNPKTKRIVWEYSKKNKSFFTSDRGGNQQLPNGNILITESDKGRVFEITKEGTTVWEWLNPHFNEEKNRRAVLYRMERVNETLFKKLLSNKGH
jgi:hypothetical protein